MEPSVLTEWGARVAEWSARYLAEIRERPVRAQTAPGAVLARLPSEPPHAPEELEKVFADFEEAILPGITHWQHPRFFAYFPANASPPSVLAEWLTATLAAQCMLWQTSPAASELETAVMGWLRGMIGLPQSFSGVIQDSASSATLAAILVARERASSGRANVAGLAGGAPLRVYCSEDAHSSVDKACRIAGIGQDNLIKIPVAPGRLRPMRLDRLETAIAEDRRAGRQPACIVASIGATGVGACDELEALADIAERERVYLHVDAAWAGAALICPEFRALAPGLERADSVVFNPHKWLFTNFDCTAHFVRDPAQLTATLGLRPPYLETPGLDSAVVDYSEWSIPLGRRFRALKLWFVIRAYGVAQLQAMIREHVRLAEGLAERLRAEPDFEIISEPVLSLFAFRHRPARGADLDAHTERLLTAINDDGRIYITQTRLDGALVLRFQVGQTYTTAEDVDVAFNVVTEIARSL